MPDTPNNFRGGKRPVIGITMDVVETPDGRIKVDCSLAYAACVQSAGGVPVMLPPIPQLIAEHVHLCDAFVLTGGDDPKMEPFNAPTHPQAKVIHPQRQAYEVELLEALRARPETPVLGICLGMQLMALHAGGTLNQYLPENLATHAAHKMAEHLVIPLPGATLAGGLVWSNHRQAVEAPGRLQVLARSEDGVVEAIADPARRYYRGVQWHPERTRNAVLGQGMFTDLLKATATRA